VIDTTEAMTVIDINTGRFVGQGSNLEEMITRNNLEAAEEIARLSRLRDIGGVIAIDFIDMAQESNRELVRNRLIECLGRDRSRSGAGRQRGHVMRPPAGSLAWSMVGETREGRRGR